MNKNWNDIIAEYAPYDRMPEFQEGFDAYERQQYDCPYDDVKAQAWDRGLEAAMRCARQIK